MSSQTQSQSQSQSQPQQPQYRRLWTRLLLTILPLFPDPPQLVNTLLPILATPIATMGMPPVSSYPDLTTHPDLDHSTSTSSSTTTSNTDSSSILSDPNDEIILFGSTMKSCAICLEDYVPGDTLKILKPCHHCFHRSCINRWLINLMRRKIPSCPVCKVELDMTTKNHLLNTEEHQTQNTSTWMNVNTNTNVNIQLIDLSVHESWIDWFTGLVKICVQNERRGQGEDSRENENNTTSWIE